jgi:hypothetical protein
MLSLTFHNPDSMQDDGKLASDRNARPGHTATFGDGHAPCPQSRPFAAVDQKRVGRLVQRGARQLVATSADSALNISLTGLIAVRCEAEVRAHIAGFGKAGRLVDRSGAGRRGRQGFAVVASEVKALASQSAKATDEIASQIAGMQAETTQAVAAIKQIGSTIAQVSTIAAAIAGAVEEQDAATREIAVNVQQAAQGTAQMAAGISDVNRGAGETGSAAAQVLASAQSLAKEGGQLRAEVDKFLDMIRAA